MAIKKAHEDIIKFLELNKSKSVSSILVEVKLMCESKKQSSTALYDTKDKLIAIFCYYHKQWELIIDVPYGSKANSSTKLNTMCKVGTSLWTKKQSTAKKANENLLIEVSKSNIKPTDSMKHKNDIETTRLLMDTTNKPKGFANQEELEKHTKCKLVNKVK